MNARTRSLLLQPTARQAAALADLLEAQRQLYNAALEERIGAWRWERRSVSRYEQFGELTGADFDWLRQYGTRPARGTLQRLDRAFQAFYRRAKAGQAPGFPRFKSASRWDSVEWPDGHGWQLDAERGRLRIMGVGEIKFRAGRTDGTPRTLIVRRVGRRWRAFVACGVQADPLSATGRTVGIDLGVHALVATSDGALIDAGRFGRRAQDRLARAQRDLARKARGSGRRRPAVERVAAHHRRVAEQRRNLAHQASRALVNGYDLIVHEDLRIANMIRSASGTADEPGTNVAAKRGLNRSIHDAGWGQLLAMIAYKAEDAGRQVIAVDPRHTSQTCAECGHVDRGNRVTQATFRCLACGHEAHADVNAARNVLRAGLALRDDREVVA